MRITIELVWDEGAGAFAGAWNHKQLALPAGELDRMPGSAFDAEAAYKPGGIQLVHLERATRHPRLVLAERTLAAGKAADAVAQLAPIHEHVLARDPELRALRAAARAAAGDRAGAVGDLSLVLAVDRLEPPALHRVRDALRALPAEDARPLLPLFCARLAVLETPLALARELPDSHWTLDTLLAALATSAAASAQRPWIVDELVAQARRLGATDAQLDGALASTRATLDHAHADDEGRQRLARDHAERCRAAAGRADAIAILLALARNLDDATRAAIEAAHPDHTTDELAELRAALAVALAAPASASERQALHAFVREAVGQPLPADLDAFLAAANGLALSWSEHRVFDAATIAARAGTIEANGVKHVALPFADDGYGFMPTLAIGPGGACHVAHLERGRLSRDATAASFTAWFSRFVASGFATL